MGAGVVCAGTDGETTTIVTARAPAMTRIGRARMLIHLYVTAVPGRTCRRQASMLSANSDLFGCAARHQFLVIGGLSN